MPLDEKVITEAHNYLFNRDVVDAAIVAKARLKECR
jgi:hypothetical protein